MSPRTLSLFTVLTLAMGLSTATAQVATGEIYGRVTDASGGVLPGVSVR